eukprot:s3_g12.t1
MEMALDVPMLEDKDPPEDHEDPQEILLAAAESGSMELARRVLRQGACPNGGRSAKAGLCRRPLCLAVEKGHTQLVWCLVDAGADKDLPDTIEQQSPLILAARFEHPQLLRFLLGTTKQKSITA